MCPSPHALLRQLAKPAALPLQLGMCAVGGQLVVQPSVVHVALRQSVVVVQVAVHAGGLMPLPASHCSPATTLRMPSPHAASVQLALQFPVSTPSSHSSPRA
jgi:hypothetical protein